MFKQATTLKYNLLNYGLFFLVIFHVFFTYEYSFFVVLLSGILFSILFRLEAIKIRLDIIDVGFIIFELCLSTSYFFSINQNNSLSGIIESITLLIFYFLLRISFERQRNKVIFIHLINYFILLALVANAVIFRNYTLDIRLLGEIHIGNFKYLYRPFGILLNDWVGILLSFIPFIMLILIHQKNKKKLFIYSTALGTTYFFIITTFSRAGLYSLIIFNISFLFLLYRYQKKAVSIKQIAIITAISILSFIFFTEDVVNTFSLFTTPSQKLSIEGRLSLWKNASSIVKEHLLFGVGTKNFPLYFSSFRDFNLIATNKISNTYLQLLIENGLVGIIGITCLFLTSLIKCYRLCFKKDRSRWIAILFFSYLMAIIFREFFFNSLFSHHLMSLLFVILLSWLGSLKITTHTYGNIFKLLLVMNTISCLMVFPQFKKMYANYYNNLGIKLSHSNKWQEAILKFNKAIRVNPRNAVYYSNKGIAFERLYNKEREISEIIKAPNEHLPDSNYLDSAIICLKKALIISPKDDSFNHNLGWLMAMKNKKNTYHHKINLSIKLDPSVAYYYISKGILYEKNSQIDSAKLMYQKAIELSPSIVDSEFFNSLKQRISTDSIIMQAIEEEKNKPLKNATYLSRLGILLFYANSKESEKYLIKAIKELPYLNRSYLYLGVYWQTHQDEKKAEKYLLKAYKIDKEDYKAANWLSELYLFRGDTLNANYFKKTTPYPINKSKHIISIKMLYQASSINDELIPKGYFEYIYK